MPKRWIYIGLVVAFVVLGELIMVFLIEHVYATWLEMCLFTMSLSHGVLLAIWAALGGRPTLWRLVAVVAALVALMWLCRHPDVQEILFILLLQSLFMATLLTLGRFFGVELTGEPAADCAPATDGAGLDSLPAEETERPWMQFSLWAVMSWTTAIAALLASFHYLPEDLVRRVSGDARGWVIAAILLFSVALIGFGAMWITLGTRWTLMRYVVLGAAGAGAIGVLLLLNAFLAPGYGPNVWELLLFCGSAMFWLVGSLALIRLAGYRLIWRRRVRL